MNKTTKIFNLSTEQGLKKAENYKRKLENTYYRVDTESQGFNKVALTGYEKGN